ncbi:MAG: hypothetical protein O3C40_10755 [Planctomycetota bacterium]|nr:hypothetical protein [Planctomycetota bacterium]
MGSVQFILMLAVFAIGATLLLVSLAVLLFILWRRPAQPESKPLDLIIDVASLDASGPSGEVPQLTYLGKPVRLAAIVVAPVGRSGTIPEADRLLDAVDQLIPGLVDVISIDHPVVKFWPGQLSTHGFAHVFFRNVKLPGERGIGSPWSSVAGKFKAGGQQYLAGLLCSAGQPNDLSEVAVDDNEQWARVLEVRRS